MKHKFTITRTQAQQYNRMLEALKRITKYSPAGKLRRQSRGAYGLDYEEALEMAYENVIREAHVIKGVKAIILNDGLQAQNDQGKNDGAAGAYTEIGDRP